MSFPSDNETWLIDAGDEVIIKKAELGIDKLSQQERLIYCIWVADYSMRNAGDLAAAHDLHPNFRSEAALLARELDLPLTRETFSLPQEALQQCYFDRFDRICTEAKGHA